MEEEAISIFETIDDETLIQLSLSGQLLSLCNALCLDIQCQLPS